MCMRKIFVLLSCLLFVQCSHLSSIKQKEESSVFNGLRVQRATLHNGLKVLLLEDHSAPIFSFQTWYNVGSKDEEPGLTGLAHLFEHMMFKETAHFKDGEFDRLLEEAGAEGQNAFTSRDYTGYVQSLPISALELVMKLESDRMVNLIVNENALQKEREVVHNERRFRNENNPDGKMYEMLYEAAFPNHPYHWPVIGYSEDLDRVNSQECHAFYRKFYAPNNATLVIVGDINPDATLQQIEKHYVHLKPSVIQRTPKTTSLPQSTKRELRLSIKSPVEKLMVAYPIPSVHHADLPALEVLRTITTVGKSSLLHERLVEAGIATEVDSENEEKKEPSLFVFFVNLQKNQKAQKALKVINSTIQEFQKGKLKPAWIQQAIAMHRLNFLDDFGSTAKKARFLGFYETVAGNFERGFELLEKMKTIQPQDLQRVAQRYFNPKQSIIIIGSPEKAMARNAQ